MVTEIFSISLKKVGAFGLVFLSKWRNAYCVVKQMAPEANNVEDQNEFLKEAYHMRFTSSN